MRRHRSISTPITALLAAIVAVSLLAGCEGSRQSATNRDGPITLTYPYGESGDDLFPSYAEVTAAAAASYVAVTVLADPATIADTGSEVVSYASGVVIHPSGLIVTAAHIAVDPKYRARVTTIDGRVHEGEIISVDRDRELAIIKVPASASLAPATFADSKGLGSGDHAVAIGSPRNRRGTVSLGRVKEPRLDYTLPYNGYEIPHPMVLSMEVEFGHSGGPVFNDRGQLIGMIAGLDLVLPRVAFAVPSNDILAYAREVARAGTDSA